MEQFIYVLLLDIVCSAYSGRQKELNHLWFLAGKVDLTSLSRIMGIWSNYSDLTRPHPKWWFSKGILLISGKSRLVKYYN